MRLAPKLLTIGAACIVIGGLSVGAAPRVAQRPPTSSTGTFNPFAVEAPAGIKVVRAASSAAQTVMPGENDPPGRAVRKNRPPVRPVYRPPVRSPFRPSPRR